MKTKFKWLAVTATLISTVSSQAASQADLWEVYQQALRNDPQLLASESALRATEERVDQTFSRLLPTLSANFTHTESESEGQQNVLLPLANQEATTDRIAVNISQVIYDHAIWKDLSINKKRALRAGVDYEVEKQNLIIRTAEAYFNVLAAQDGLSFSNSEVEAISQELEQTKQRFEVGLIAITDVHEAQARHDQALADMIQAQNLLDNSVEALGEITNQYNEQLAPLKSKFALQPPSPSNVKDWVKEAEENNLTLNARIIDKDIARETISRNWAGHLPTLNFQGAYNDTESVTDLELFGDDGTAVPCSRAGQPIEFRCQAEPFSESTTLSVTLNVPIYQGGSVNAQVREAQHLFQQSVHNMEQAYRAAVRQTRSSFLGIKASISSVNALEQSTVSSQSALEATQAGFEVGTRTIVDVLQSTQTLFNAKRNLARAKYDYILNTLRLKNAAGTLTENDLRKVNELLNQG